MNKKLKECDNCHKEHRQRDLGKIHNKHYCPDCKKEIRLRHRKETIDKENIKDDLRVLKNKASREYRARKLGRKIRDKPGRPKKPIDLNAKPKIKSIKRKKTNKTYSYLTNDEKQIIFNKLVKQGYSFKEADVRTNDLTTYLKDLSIELKNKYKEVGERNRIFKEEFNKMLEELNGNT